MCTKMFFFFVSSQYYSQSIQLHVLYLVQWSACHLYIITT